MPEIVKRLAPEKDTLRELYLKSGNLCMFPDCAERMINKEGVFVGQVCHIEAAEEGGERFNPNQTNEQRRHFSNLMLMCYPHHTITNDVGAFTVERLKGFKATHEARFTDIAGTIERAVVQDLTKTTKPTKPRRLKRLSEALKWPSLTDEELADSVKELDTWIEKLARISPDSRRIFLYIIERMDRTNHVPYREIKQVVNITPDSLAEHIGTLDRYNLIGEGHPDDFGGQIRVTNLASGWPIAADIKSFAHAVGIPLDLIVVQLDFSLLD